MTHALPVVHADDWIVVLDKPSGVPSQPEPGGAADVAALLAPTLGPLAVHHRLDRPASGLLVLSRHPDANAGLARAFRERTAARTYRAVLVGDRLQPGDTWTWDMPLDGKPARSHARVLTAGPGLRATELRLDTGRTHQLRRHAAMFGMPILGDRRYGLEVGTWWPRLVLHAWRLALPHPVTGESLAFEAPLPDDLAEAWQAAGG